MNATQDVVIQPEITGSLTGSSFEWTIGSEALNKLTKEDLAITDVVTTLQPNKYYTITSAEPDASITLAKPAGGDAVAIKNGTSTQFNIFTFWGCQIQSLQPDGAALFTCGTSGYWDANYIVSDDSVTREICDSARLSFIESHKNRTFIRH